MEEVQIYTKDTPLTVITETPNPVQVGVIYKPVDVNGDMVSPNPYGWKSTEKIEGYVFLPTLQKPKASCNQCELPQGGDACKLFNCGNRKRWNNEDFCIFGFKVKFDPEINAYVVDSRVDYNWVYFEIPVINEDIAKRYLVDLRGIEICSKSEDEYLLQQATLSSFFQERPLYEWNFDHEYGLMVKQIKRINKAKKND